MRASGLRFEFLGQRIARRRHSFNSTTVIGHRPSLAEPGGDGQVVLVHPMIDNDDLAILFQPVFVTSACIPVVDLFALMFTRASAMLPNGSS